MARELRPLVRNWKLEINQDGVAVYSSADAVAAYAGIGAERVRLAVDAALSLGPVHEIVSAGWAGGLHPGMRGGMVRRIDRVIDASSGEVFALEPKKQSGNGNGASGTVLLTMERFASAAEKRHLRERFKADMVDMEASVVAEIAGEKGIPCIAIKAVSDDDSFDLPGIERYSTADGRFREGAFAAYVVLRPALWKATAQMGRTSSLAAKELCRELERHIAGHRAGLGGERNETRPAAPPGVNAIRNEGVG